MAGTHPGRAAPAAAGPVVRCRSVSGRRLDQGDGLHGDVRTRSGVRDEAPVRALDADVGAQHLEHACIHQGAELLDTFRRRPDR